jgi:hypothetical protein
MKKIVLIFGMVFMLSCTIGFSNTPVASATSEDSAEYENTDPMMEEAANESAEEIFVEEEGEMPQEETMMTDEAPLDASEENVEETGEDSAMEEKVETEE